jgi:hypothetical protein
MKYFVFKLIPPRKTFAVDMTPAEIELMKLHALYWSNLMRAKKVLVFGPVADPDGPYGIGIVSLEDPSEASTIADNDPVISAGAGFESVVTPMASAVLPHMVAGA